MAAWEDEEELEVVFVQAHQRQSLLPLLRQECRELGYDDALPETPERLVGQSWVMVRPPAAYPYAEPSGDHLQARLCKSLEGMVLVSRSRHTAHSAAGNVRSNSSQAVYSRQASHASHLSRGTSLHHPRSSRMWDEPCLQRIRRRGCSVDRRALLKAVACASARQQARQSSYQPLLPLALHKDLAFLDRVATAVEERNLKWALHHMMHAEPSEASAVQPVVVHSVPGASGSTSGSTSAGKASSGSGSKCGSPKHAPDTSGVVVLTEGSVRMVAAAVHIQCCWRAYCARQRVAVLAVQRRAAVCLQRWWGACRLKSRLRMLTAAKRATESASAQRVTNLLCLDAGSYLLIKQLQHFPLDMFPESRLQFAFNDDGHLLLVAADDALRPGLPEWLGANIPVINAEGAAELGLEVQGQEAAMQLLKHGSSVKELIPHENVTAGLCSASDIVSVITFSSMATSIQRAALLAALTFDPRLNTCAQINPISKTGLMVASLAVHMPLSGQHSSSDMPSSPMPAAREPSFCSSPKRKAYKASASLRFTEGGSGSRLRATEASATLDSFISSASGGGDSGGQTQRSDACDSNADAACASQQATPRTARSRRLHNSHTSTRATAGVTFALPMQSSSAASIGSAHYAADGDNTDAADGAAVIQSALSSRSGVPSRGGASGLVSAGGGVQPWSPPVSPGRQQQDSEAATLCSTSAVAVCADAQDMSEYLNELKVKQALAIRQQRLLGEQAVLQHQAEDLKRRQEHISFAKHAGNSGVAGNSIISTGSDENVVRLINTSNVVAPGYQPASVSEAAQATQQHKQQLAADLTQQTQEQRQQLSAGATQAKQALEDTAKRLQAQGQLHDQVLQSWVEQQAQEGHEAAARRVQMLRERRKQRPAVAAGERAFAAAFGRQCNTFDKQVRSHEARALHDAAQRRATLHAGQLCAQAELADLSLKQQQLERQDEVSRAAQEQKAELGEQGSAARAVAELQTAAHRALVASRRLAREEMLQRIGPAGGVWGSANPEELLNQPLDVAYVGDARNVGMQQGVAANE